MRSRANGEERQASRMDQARQSVEPEVMLDIFKRTMPFQVVSDAMLRKIAAVSWRVTYEPGAVIYDAGDRADDIYIVVSGKIEHALEPDVHARRPVQTLKSGDVLGWGAVLEQFPGAVRVGDLYRARGGRAHQWRRALAPARIRSGCGRRRHEPLCDDDPAGLHGSGPDRATTLDSPPAARGR